MATLGRRPSNAALTSADIPDDSITAAKIVAGAVTSDVVYLENNTSTQTLSGTYSTERLYFNDSYQLTGDVTVTGHLALGSIADEDIVITNDGTERTITGSGTLESGELLKSEQSDLTGMTGVLNNSVQDNITRLGAVASGSIGSGVTGFTGIKESDAWVIDTAFTGEASPIASNWVRNTHHNFALIGTGMTQSNGNFTFPSTGHWFIQFYANHYQNGSARYIGAYIQTTVNTGSSYLSTAVNYTNLEPILSDTAYTQNNVHQVFDVTNVSTHKVRFTIAGNPANFTNGAEWTGVSFLRIGDT
jgi:hypothetical protein